MSASRMAGCKGKLFKIPGCRQPTSVWCCMERADSFQPEVCVRLFSPNASDTRHTSRPARCLMKNSSFMPGNSRSRFDIGIMHS